MDDREARRLHRLLAGGRLSRPETDAIRERVLDAIERDERRSPRRLRYGAWAGAALAAAAAALLAVRVPESPTHPNLPGAGQAGQRSARPILRLRCSSGTLTACPRTSELIFSATGLRAPAVLSAYAEPLDPALAPVFYFSEQDGGAPLAVPKSPTRAVEHAVRIPASQRAGRYRVHLFVAERALAREQMRSGARGAQGTKAELLIVE
jgi:hypothetical protein